MVGSFFLVGGIFRVVAAMTLRLHHWGWMLLNGVITALLGLLVLAEWPSSGLFVIGLFLGIDMLFNGWTWVMLSLGPAQLAGREIKVATSVAAARLPTTARAAARLRKLLGAEKPRCTTATGRIDTVRSVSTSAARRAIKRQRHHDSFVSFGNSIA